MLTETIGYIATFVSTLAFLPQVIKVYTTKSVKDISLIAFSQIILGAILWVIYGIMIWSLPVILANSVIGFFSVLIIIAKFKYRKDYDNKL